MKNYTKVAKHKRDYINFLCPIAAKTLVSIYGIGTNYHNEFDKFYAKITKTARYGGKNWKFEVEEVILNLKK